MEHGKPFSAADSPLVDFDAVCQKLRAAVEPARAHAVSLHDERGDVLWLSESSMGPDEHNAVREAVEAFSGAGSSPVLVYDLGDSRSAVLLRAVNARRSMVGVIMLIMDARVVKQDARGALKMMTPKLQRVLADFATMRPDIKPAVTPVTPPAPAPAATRGPQVAVRAVPAAALTLVDEPRARDRQPRRAPRHRPSGHSARPGRLGTGRLATSAGRNISGNRSLTRRIAPQPHCVACAAPGAVDQG